MGQKTLYWVLGVTVGIFAFFIMFIKSDLFAGAVGGGYGCGNSYPLNRPHAPCRSVFCANFSDNFGDNRRFVATRADECHTLKG
jgi:hypothetical protein